MVEAQTVIPTNEQAPQPTQIVWTQTALKEMIKKELGAKLAQQSDCIVTHESHYHPDAIHHNSNGTTDYGLFQINSIHALKDTPMHPRFDISRAFDPIYNAWYAGTILAAQHNWSAWATARVCGYN